MFVFIRRSVLFGSLLVAALQVTASERDLRNTVALGALVFSDNCKQCHKLDGYGEEALYPSLRDPKLLANPTLLIRTILDGRQGHQDRRLMPSLEFLTNREITSIVAFITNSWGEKVVLINDEDVARARERDSK